MTAGLTAAVSAADLDIHKNLTTGEEYASRNGEMFILKNDLSDIIQMLKVFKAWNFLEWTYGGCHQ